MSHDGEIAIMEARADLLTRTSGHDGRPAATAWRDLGAALWDLAGDSVGAVRAWLRAARLAPVRGFATLGVDLIHFGGAEFALRTLTRRMEEETDPLVKGALAGEAARAALATGDPRRAFDLAEAALGLHPGYSDALEVAERAAAESSREEGLSALYDAVAGRALGRFGRRAAHYRGARYFEGRNERALALRHAAQAFLAVPTEGATFMLLARAAERAGDRAQAMRTIEQVAERATRAQARAAWLLRAATIAGPGEEGARRKVDVLLQATALSPDTATIGLLGDAARELVRAAPEEIDGLELRLARASKVLATKLEGPEGARALLAFAALMLELWEDADGGLSAIEKALGMDADIDEYATLVRSASVLAKAEGAREVLERTLANAEKPYSNVGAAACKLFAALATQLGDAALHGRAVVLAAERDSEDDALVLEADVVVRELGDPALVERLGKKVPPARRAQALASWARERALEGAHVEAAAALERASELSEGKTKEDIEQALRAAYEAAGRGTEIRAARPAGGPGGASQSPGARRALDGDRRTPREAPRPPRGHPRVAGGGEARPRSGRAVERPRAGRRARRRRRRPRRGAPRDRCAREGRREGRRLQAARRAHERRGDFEAAEHAYRLVMGLDADDEDADQGIEGLISRAGRYEELAAHLARRAQRLAQHSGMRETLRAVRLRRAAILEQRLGRVHDACDELDPPHRVARQLERPPLPRRSLRENGRVRAGRSALEARGGAGARSEHRRTSSSCAPRPRPRRRAISRRRSATCAPSW